MKGIKALIINDLKKEGQLTSADLSKKFVISRQAVHKHIQALILEGKVLKAGPSRKTSFYILNIPSARKKLFGRQTRIQKKVKASGLEEDKIYDQLVTPSGLLEKLSNDAKTNFHYAFTEILNNAVDHSDTKNIDIAVSYDKACVSFWISDKGVGIFENIRRKKDLASELSAVQDLLKGKQTTMPSLHSGEGIFFTSKIADKFILESHKKRLLVDNTIDDVFIEDIRFKKGTHAFFEISTQSKKDLSALFKNYTGEDYKFDKSKVVVRLFKRENTYMSRSQAKRLLHSLGDFSEVILDFKDVSTIGQGFAHEMFSVFQKTNHGTRLVPINCNENVDLMIRHAL